jgi:hypothetical protein
MAFASTITKAAQSFFGDKKVASGTWTNANGDTGGDINTGLTICEYISLTVNASSAGSITSVPCVNETLPIAGSAVTIVTLDGQDGYWWAYGY